MMHLNSGGVGGVATAGGRQPKPVSGFPPTATSQTSNMSGTTNANTMQDPAATIANRAMMIQAASQFQHLMFLQQRGGKNNQGDSSGKSAAALGSQTPSTNAPTSSQTSNISSLNKRPFPGTGGPDSKLEYQPQKKRLKTDADAAAQTQVDPTLKFVNQRVARLFRVRSTNRQHMGGFVNKLFFGTVVAQEPCKKQMDVDATSSMGDRTQSAADKMKDEVEYTWHVLYDDGDEADYDLETVKQAIKLYEHNVISDRRQVLVTRSEEVDEDYEEKGAEASSGEEDDEDFVPVSLSSAFAAPTKKKRGRPFKNPPESVAKAPPSTMTQPTVGATKPPIAQAASLKPPPPQAAAMQSVPPPMLQAAAMQSFQMQAAQQQAFQMQVAQQQQAFQMQAAMMRQMPVQQAQMHARTMPATPQTVQQAPARGLPAPPSAVSQKPVASKPKTSAPPRSRAEEIWCGPPDDQIEGGWPPGWTKRIFKRVNSAKKHTDPYWYSPKEQCKLRSLREVSRFMDALKIENGDEKEAWKRFKGRK